MPNIGLRKFRHGTSIVLSTKLSELVDHTYDGRRVIGLSYHIISYQKFIVRRLLRGPGPYVHYKSQPNDKTRRSTKKSTNIKSLTKIV